MNYFVDFQEEFLLKGTFIYFFVREGKFEKLSDFFCSRDPENRLSENPIFDMKT